MAKIIGRKAERQQLERLLNAKEAEFLVVYGRRRVGKTFLIRNYFKDLTYTEIHRHIYGKLIKCVK